MAERIYGYLQFMSTRTDDDSGIDLLLFVALQVSTVWTSSRLKFCITISLRVTSLRSTVIRLVTNLSLRYQDTVGAGLPTEIHQFRFSSLRVSQAEKLSHSVSTKRDASRRSFQSESARIERCSSFNRIYRYLYALNKLATIARYRCRFNGTSIVTRLLLRLLFKKNKI